MAAWGEKAGTLSLLNVIDSSGAPVGCVRTDAQTQASHWLELGGHCRLSCTAELIPRLLPPRGEKTTRTKWEKHFSVLLITDKVSQKLCINADWPLFWRETFLASGEVDLYWTLGRAVFSMDLNAVEVPWELNYIWVLFTPYFSFQTGFYDSHGEKNDPRSVLCPSGSFR